MRDDRGEGPTGPLARRRSVRQEEPLGQPQRSEGRRQLAPAAHPRGPRNGLRSAFRAYVRFRRAGSPHSGAYRLDLAFLQDRDQPPDPSHSSFHHGTGIHVQRRNPGGAFRSVRLPGLRCISSDHLHTGFSHTRDSAQDSGAQVRLLGRVPRLSLGPSVRSLTCGDNRNRLHGSRRSHGSRQHDQGTVR